MGRLLYVVGCVFCLLVGMLFGMLSVDCSSLCNGTVVNHTVYIRANCTECASCGACVCQPCGGCPACAECTNVTDYIRRIYGCELALQRYERLNTTYYAENLTSQLVDCNRTVFRLNSSLEVIKQALT